MRVKHTFAVFPQDVFMATMGVLARVCAPEAAMQSVARMPGVARQWEAVAQLLARKVDLERKYISRLEGA